MYILSDRGMNCNSISSYISAGICMSPLTPLGKTPKRVSSVTHPEVLAGTVCCVFLGLSALSFLYDLAN